MLDSALTYFLPDYVDLVEELVAYFGGFFVAGVLACFIFWAISIAISSVFGWLNAWASARE